MHRFDSIFSPKSIVIIGASSIPGTPGYEILNNIKEGGYRGKLYPVNQKAKSISGIQSIQTVKDTPANVDFAVVVCPDNPCLKAVETAIKKNIKGITIISSGVHKGISKRIEIENKIISMCKEEGVRIVGPGCLGIINPLSSVRLNASLYKYMPASGGISFICQSDALCTAVLDFARENNFGFSKFISVGDKSDVDEVDLLYYLHQDPDTDVIMIYLEELIKGPEFINAVQKITSEKKSTPVLAIKSGAASPEIMAVMSHAKALMGSVSIYDVVFQQAGIIQAGSIEELFDCAGAFTHRNKKKKPTASRKVPIGNRVAVITNAKGPGSMATDLTVSSGLKLAEFKIKTVKSLAKTLCNTAGVHNPVNVSGDLSLECYTKALGEVLEDEGVDIALLIFTPRSISNSVETAKIIVRAAKNSSKPIFCCFMGIVDISSGVKYLHDNGIPVFRFPENAIRALGALCKYANWVNRQYLSEFSFKHEKEKAEHIIKNCIETGSTILGELDGAELLKCYGFKALSGNIAQIEDEAIDIAEKIKYPVAMKIVSAHILHKFDAGGVVLELENQDHVKSAYKDIIEKAKIYNPEAVIDGVLIQKMAQPGGEVILGMNRYPVFGPLLMFGLGGIFVEVFQDVIFRFAPVGRNEARRMIQGIRGYKIFKGFRGRPKSDIAVLEESIVSLSDMVMNHPEINELNINPLLVHEEGNGATVADCRIVLKPPYDSGR